MPYEYEYVNAMANTSDKTPEERLDALEMRTNALSDAMIVQGFMQGRTERNLAELTEGVRDLTRVVQILADNQSSMQAALQGLIEQMDRFLRGERGNGHSAA